MKRMIMTALLLTLTALNAAASGGPEATPGELLVFPAGVREQTEYRINTGRKAVLADGTYNSVYRMKTPARGKVFLDMELNLATAGEFRLEQSEIRLVDISMAGVRTYEPFDWFLDRGLNQERGRVLTFTEKAILAALFEVPTGRLDKLVLFIGDHRVGTVAELMSQSPQIL